MMHLMNTRFLISSILLAFVCAENVVDQQTNVRRRVEGDDNQNIQLLQQVNAIHEQINMDIETDEEMYRLLKVVSVA
jgi:cyanate lyase